MYLITGGRKTQSALYKLTYKGTESTAPAKSQDPPAAVSARKLRKDLEAYHTKPNDAAITPAVAQLGSADRAIRTAARIALRRRTPHRQRPWCESVSRRYQRLGGRSAYACLGEISERSSLGPDGHGRSSAVTIGEDRGRSSVANRRWSRTVGIRAVWRGAGDVGGRLAAINPVVSHHQGRYRWPRPNDRLGLSVHDPHPTSILLSTDP